MTSRPTDRVSHPRHEQDLAKLNQELSCATWEIGWSAEREPRTETAKPARPLPREGRS
jgi:hypothetical protein